MKLFRESGARAADDPKKLVKTTKPPGLRRETRVTESSDSQIRREDLSEREIVPRI